MGDGTAVGVGVGVGVAVGVGEGADAGSKTVTVEPTTRRVPPTGSVRITPIPTVEVGAEAVVKPAPATLSSAACTSSPMTVGTALYPEATVTATALPKAARSPETGEVSITVPSVQRLSADVTTPTTNPAETIRSLASSSWSCATSGTRGRVSATEAGDVGSGDGVDVNGSGVGSVVTDAEGEVANEITTPKVTAAATVANIAMPAGRRRRCTAANGLTTGEDARGGVAVVPSTRVTPVRSS